MSEFTEVEDTRTGLMQRVPTHWVGDPVLGRFIVKTPRQRALDGELGPAPTDESTVPEIRGFAKDAGIDVTGLSRKDELLAAVRAVIGTDPLPEPGSDAGVDVATPTGVVDPAGSTSPDDPGTTDPAPEPSDGGNTETPADGA